jgi:FAD:protein FMN transferase
VSASGWRFEAIGTEWSIETPAELDPDARDAVAERIARFDATWSRFRDDSLVAELARDGGRRRLPDESGPLLELYRHLHAATGGRMTPLVGRSLEALGYDAAYRLVPGAPVAAPAWADAIAWHADELELDLLRPALLDVGAAGKGLLVDLVGEVLIAHGVADSVVDASGDLRIRGAGIGRTERIALEHPGDPSRAVGIAEPGVGALAASAGDRRAWAGVHHILDATTGLPAREVLATWTVADDAMTADGAATALFFADGETIAAALGPVRLDWVRMFADGRLECSPSFPGEVFR